MLDSPAWELDCHASSASTLQVSRHLRLSVSGRRVTFWLPCRARNGHGAPRSASADLFRVRECYLPLMLSHPRPEMPHEVHARPLVSIAVGRDRYSVGYSPSGSRPVSLASTWGVVRAQCHLVDEGKWDKAIQLRGRVSIGSLDPARASRRMNMR